MLNTEAAFGYIRGNIKYTQESQKTQLFAAGLTSIPGNANEDTHTIYCQDDHSAAFGVFDGHGGPFASKLSSTSFCSMSLEYVDTMLRYFEGQSLDDDTIDSLFCESIRQTSEEIDREVKRQGKSGTTCNSVFLKTLSDGRLRVFCANTGDSRSVLFRRTESIFMSEDHNLSLPREIHRIIHKKEAKWYPLPGDPKKFTWNEEQCPRRNLSTGEKLQLEQLLSMAEPIQMYPSEDKLDSAREVVSKLKKQSIKDFTDACWDVYWDVSDTCEEDFNDSSRGSIFLNPALSNSMDDLDVTIHNTPMAALTGHSHHRGAVVEVQTNCNFASVFQGNLDILQSSNRGSIGGFGTPPESPKLRYPMANHSIAWPASLPAGQPSPPQSPHRAESVVKDIIRLLVKETYRVFNAEKVSYWCPEASARNGSGVGGGSGGVGGGDFATGDLLPRATLCCIVSPDITGVEVGLDEGLVGKCFSTGEIVYSRDAGSDPSRISRFDEQMNVVVKSVVCVPLLDVDSSNVFGVLHVINKKSSGSQEEGFSRREILQMKAMCAQTARSLSYGRTRTASDPAGDKLKETTDEKPLVYKYSFVANRVGEMSQKQGPCALFSRYNVSITMTRSLGDRYAARSCASVPEITAVTLSVGEYARIILATDGVWDVISLADAETMVRRIYDPRKASYAVAARARELRETNRMKIDDIVCLVVDVNPDSPSRGPAPAAMPTGCGCVIA